jgi:hypothetical protein
MREAEKNFQMEDAIHGATCALNGFLESIHSPGDVLLKWVGYKNVVVSGVAVIGASAREVIDTVVCVVVARSITRRAGWWCGP